MTENRCTLAGFSFVQGVGLQTGADVSLAFRPADFGKGVVFRRTDLPGSPEVPASVENVCSTDRRTVLGAGNITVQMIEHVLAAVYAHGIDDIVIDLDGPEPPAGDGSAGMFFEKIEQAGVVENGGPKDVFEPFEPLSFVFGDSSYQVVPGGRAVSVTLEFDHPLIKTQTLSIELTKETFARELAFARTFGFTDEIDELKGRGLIRGATMDMGILLSRSDIVNGPLRWDDEFVRHKMVDLLGDLALLGGRLEGSVHAVRPSHQGNVAFVRELKRMLANGD